jgi:hypothetical protein
MSAFPRNAPCPCGSGLKYKRCCIGRERELLERAAALEEVLALPSVSPLLRPCEGAFEAWLDGLDEPEITRQLIEDGGSRLSPGERDRIVQACAAEYGDRWREVAEQVGVEDATTTLLVGAITAALHEVRTLPPDALDHLEVCDVCRGEAAHALALMIDPCDLWSVSEAAFVADAGGWVERARAELWTDAHERRLELLVDRLRRLLPMASHARASAALERAFAEFEREAGVRVRLAALLLADAVEILELLDARAA